MIIAFIFNDISTEFYSVTNLFIYFYENYFCAMLDLHRGMKGLNPCSPNWKVNNSMICITIT